MPTLALAYVSYPSRTRRPQRLDHALGEARGFAWGGDPFEQDGELVPTEAGDRVRATQAGRETLSHHDQQPIARVVPEAVVDHLEAIQVEEEHGNGDAAPAGAGERLGEAVHEQGSVGQAGQWVVERQVSQLLLRPVPLGDVHRHAAHESPPGQVLEGKLQRQPVARLAVGGGNGFLGLQRLPGREHGQVVGAQLLSRHLRPQRKVVLAPDVLKFPLEQPGEGLVDIDVAQLLVLHEGDRRAVAHERREARLARPRFGVESGPADGDVDVLAEREHQPEVRLCQRDAGRALQVEHTDDPVLVAQGHADFRDNPLEGGEEIGVDAPILQQHRLPGAGDPTHHPSRQRDAVEHLVVTDLVLEHEVLCLDQVEADHRVAEGLGDRLDDRAEEVRQVQLPRHRRADLIP